MIDLLRFVINSDSALGAYCFGTIKGHVLTCSDAKNVQ